MIVKTGANYQAEGGYIEASKKDDGAIVNINGVENEILVMNGYPASIAKVHLKRAESFTASITMPCVYLAGDQFETGAYGFGSEVTDYDIYLIAGIQIYLTINPSTPIKAGEGSHNCEIATKSGRYYLCVTGNDPVIVFEEAE